MSQSTRAHRLAQKAYQIGGQKLLLPVLCNIFKANLQDGKDIGDDNVLADIAVKVGMMNKKEVGYLSSSLGYLAKPLSILPGPRIYRIARARKGSERHVR